MVPSYGVYIYQLVRFACICNNVSDFNDRKLVMQKNAYIKDIVFITFTKFYKDLVYNPGYKFRFYKKIAFPILFFCHLINKLS